MDQIKNNYPLLNARTILERFALKNATKHPGTGQGFFRWYL